MARGRGSRGLGRVAVPPHFIRLYVNYSKFQKIVASNFDVSLPCESKCQSCIPRLRILALPQFRGVITEDINELLSWKRLYFAILLLLMSKLANRCKR